MNKKRVIDNIFRVGIVVLTSTVYSLSVIWFLEPAGMIAIGMTACGQILSRLFDFINIHIPIGVFSLLLNIPLCVIGAKHVSPRFIVFTVLSVLVQSFWTMGWDWLNIDFGLNPNDKFFLGVVAALFGGAGIGIALRYGTSTGGVDILAQAISFKKNISIGFMSLVVNVIVAILGAIVYGNPAIAFYTIVRILAQSVVTDKVHTSYNYLKVEIITTKPEEVSQLLLTDIGRGITMVSAIGAYTHTEKSILETIISSYEVHRVIDDARKIDPGVFITVSPVKRVVGNFKRKTIA